MKILFIFLVLLSSTALDAQTQKKIKKAKKLKAKESKVVAKDAPCDSKEDLLKKLEEEKKKQEMAKEPKAFSLQGGDTGCKVK